MGKKKSENSEEMEMNTETKTMKSSENKNLILSLAGAGIALLQLAATIVFMVNLHTINILPEDYKILVGILLGLFVLITAITQRWLIPGWVTKVLGFLLSAIMIMGSIYIDITYRSMDKITDVTTQTNTINVYVLKDNEAQDIKDILDKNFGVLEVMDRTYTDLTVEIIESENNATLNLVDYGSLSDLATALYDGSVEAIILNSSYVSVLSELEGFEDFEEATRVIKSVDKEEEIQIDPIEIETGEDDNPLLHDKDGHVICLYISGADVEGSPTVKRNSDVNILCIINKTTKQILLLNTPRDFYVEIQVDGGHLDKLTHAGCRGVDCSIATLEKFYGIDIDDYVRVNFTGFRQIIDSLGGVEVWSEYEFTSHHGKFHFTKGFNHMNGAQALGFCRERYAFGSGDNQRGRNQMEVIKAIIEKMEKPGALLNYQATLNAISNSMVTSMTYDEITELAQFQISEMPTWQIQNYAVTGKGSMEQCYSLGSGKYYVMFPNEDTVNQAKEYMRAMYNDEIITVQ